MCGIVAYIGPDQAYDFLIKGLQRLEYRGYDSAGIALLNHELKVFKESGKVSDLVASAEGKDVTGTKGIGHTRWATHGEPNKTNAHPHLSESGDLAVIHNGIIENYATLKEALVQKGYSFKSDTDTEVLIYLIEDIQLNEKVDLFEAVRLALNEVVGAYAIVILSKRDPNVLIGARKGSPLVVGIGKQEGEYFLASDATPIVEYTRDVSYLDDGEIAVVKDGKLSIKTIENVEKTPYIQTLAITLDAIEKGGYDHFMLKEIYEQPKSISDSMRGRYHPKDLTFAMQSLKEFGPKIKNLKRVVIVGCGTSWHAGLVGEYLIEEFARLPVEVEYASEFRYRNPIINSEDLVIAISQSGETADTFNRSQDSLVSAEARIRYAALRSVRKIDPKEADLENRAFMDIDENIKLTNKHKNLLWLVRLRSFIVDGNYTKALAYLSALPLTGLKPVDRRVFQADGAEVVYGIIQGLYENSEYSKVVKEWNRFKDNYVRKVANDPYMNFIVGKSYLNLGLYDGFEELYKDFKKLAESPVRSFPLWVKGVAMITPTKCCLSLMLLRI
jgi:hypothetical protein